MRWTTKAKLQNLIDKLPPRAAYWLYYQLQRQAGGLRQVNPVSRFEAAARIASYIRSAGKNLDGKKCIEIGTGRRPNVAIGLWLCGAEQVMTVDLHPYLTDILISEDRAFVSANRSAIEKIFCEFRETPSFVKRLDLLADRKISSKALLAHANIQYLAPADASCLDVREQSYDYHVSYTVLEHIPEKILKAIISEGRRVLNESGLLVHLIDLTDHFSHDDSDISKINFLRFSEREWLSIVNNRFMYQNRLRVCQYDALFECLNIKSEVVFKRVDKAMQEALSQGFPVSDEFRWMNAEALATTAAHYVLRP